MRLKALGLALSLALAFGGLFALRHGAILIGLGLCLLAGLIFVWLSRSIESSPPSSAAPIQFTRREILLPLVLWGAGLYLTFLVVENVVTPPRTPQDGRLVAAAWILSVVFHVAGTLVAARWRPPQGLVIRGWFSENRNEILLVSGLTLVALVLRIAGLSQHPYPWSGDEASVAIEGRQIIQGAAKTLFGTGWSGQPTWSFLPTGISVAIFGSTIFATRIVSAIAGTLTVPALYLLGRVLYGRDAALFSAVALVAYPYHLHFSRLGVNNVNDGFIAALVLFLCFYSLRRDSIPVYTLTGVALGLSIYTYVGSRLVVALGAFVFIFIILTRKSFLRTHLYHLAALGASTLVTALPMGLFFLRNPQVFMTRINQEGIFQSGWLGRHIAQTGQNVWQVLLDQFSRSTLVYIAQPAHANFFPSSQPFLTFLGSAFFILGMIYALAHLRRLEYLIVLLWFWSVIILGSVLTLNPPASTRMVMAIPATALFVGLGLQKVFEASQKTGILSWRLGRVLCAAALAIMVLQGAFFYFGEFRTDHLFRDPNSELATEVAKELQGLGPDYSLYMLGAPRVFVTFPTIAYLNPANRLQDLPDASTRSLSLLDHSRRMLIVSIPEQVANLREIAQAVPGGQWETIQRLTQPEVLYYAYLVAQPQP